MSNAFHAREISIRQTVIITVSQTRKLRHRAVKTHSYVGRARISLNGCVRGSRGEEVKGASVPGDGPEQAPGVPTGWYFMVLDSIFLCIYVVEAMLKIIALGSTYFSDSWNKLGGWGWGACVLV